MNIVKAFKESERLGRFVDLSKQIVVDLTLDANGNQVHGTVDKYDVEIDMAGGRGTDAKVFCSCSDFKFTCYPCLHEKGAVTRDIKFDEPMVKKPTKRTHIQRAHNKPCMCKHLMTALEVMEDKLPLSIAARAELDQF